MLIDENGQQVGAVDTREAQYRANQAGLDLVEVSPLSRPPVCKIMDYGSYQYQQEKKERKQRAKQKKIEVKGLRLSLKIGPHDLELRKNQAVKFLKKGDKVKVEMILRGRERAFISRANEIIEQFAESLTEVAVVEQHLTRQGGRLSMLLGKK